MAAVIWMVPVDPVPADRSAIFRLLEHVRLGRVRVVETPALMQEARNDDVAVIVADKIVPAVVDHLQVLVRNAVPVLVLARQLPEHHESLLLGLLAFDALELPASPRRITSRIKAAQRAGRLSVAGPPAARLGFGAVEVDVDRRLVLVHGKPVALTRAEFDLLALLARDPYRVVGREELRVVDERRPLSPRSLESHLSRTRRKIEDAGGPRVIEAVRGYGYRLGPVSPKDSVAGGSGSPGPSRVMSGEHTG